MRPVTIEQRLVSGFFQTALLAALTMFILVPLLPSTSAAKLNSYNTGFSCSTSGCHPTAITWKAGFIPTIETAFTNVTAGGTITKYVDNATTPINADSGDVIELDWTFNNMADTGESGVTIWVPSGWTLARGTDNNPDTVLSVWHESWEASDNGTGELGLDWQGTDTTPASPVSTDSTNSPDGWAVIYNGQWGAATDAAAAADDGVLGNGDLDQMNQRMGTDVSVTVPAATPTGTYYIEVFGSGKGIKDQGQGQTVKGSIGMLLQINVTAAGDSTPPAVTAITPFNVDYNGTHVDASFDLAASITEANTLSSCEYQVNGGAWTAGTVGGSAPNWTCTVTGGLGPYAHNTALALNFRGTDNSTNTGTGTAINRTVDANVPATTDNAPAGWQGTDVTVTLTPDDSGAGNSGVQLTQYCIDTTNTCTPGTTGTSASVTQTAGTAGTQYVRYRSTDNVDNVETIQSTGAIQIDKKGPTDGTLTVTPGDTVNALSWTAAADPDSGLRTSTIYEVRFVTGATPPADCASGTSIYGPGDNLSFNHTGLTNSTQYSYRVCAYDNMNNASAGATGSGTPTSSDSTPPAVTTITPSNVDYNGTHVDASFDLAASITEANTLSSCEYQVNGGAWTAGTVGGSAPNWTCTVTGGLGPYAHNTALALNFRGTDDSTNTGTGTAINRTVDANVPATTDNAPAGWQGANVTVTLTPDDSGAGNSGVQLTQYCIDTTNTCIPGTTGTSASVTQAAGTAGAQYVRYRSTDNVDNVETIQSTGAIQIDKKGPTDGTLTVTPGDTVNALSWTAATDPDSGLRTGTIYEVRFVTGATPPADCASGTSIYGPGDNLSFNHTGLTNSTQYSYRVCAYDNMNNASVGATGSGTPTGGGDTTPPNVSSTIPTNGASGIALNAPVTINWDENVNCGTVNTTNITSTSPGWTFTSCSGSQAVFTPSGQANSTDYSVTVGTGVTDVVGNPMNASYGFSYTTIAAVGVEPSLNTTTLYWTIVNKESSAKTTTAKLGATITTDGGSTITERGIVWSTSDATPTIGEAGVTKVTEGGTDVGVFFANVSGMTKATQVYFQGYATNSTGTGYSGVANFWTEPDTAAAPTVDPPSGTNYFDLTVNYTKPATADGVLVVVRQSFSNKTAPFDGTEYTADPRIGKGDTTDPGCLFYCDYVVANETTNGSVTITGLKEGIAHYFAVYAYKGTGTGISGTNYVQTITATGPVTTDAVPFAGTSHNEIFVAANSTYNIVSDTGTPGTMTSADCANCHGSHHTSQLLPIGIDMYTKCFTCHQAGGAADDGTGNAKINIGMHLADGSVDCGTCHSMHSFRTEELYSTDHTGTEGFNLSFIRKNMSKYMNPTDYPPPAGGGSTTALDNTVFQVRPDHFAFASADPDPTTGNTYNAVCQTCHTDDAKTSHHQQDATDDHKVNANCTGCHSHKNTDEYSAFAPSGGHDASHFSWDGNCGNCHNTGTEAVVSVVHGDICTLCHSDGAGGAGTAIPGPVGFGVDGDASIAAALADYTTATCTTCHDVADADVNAGSLGGIHHWNKNDGVVGEAQCTTKCHTVNGHKGDHTASIADSTTNCISCHTGTAGGDADNGAPIASGDDKIHDFCISCHAIAATPGATGILGTVTANGGSGTINVIAPTGGDCTDCHDLWAFTDHSHHTLASNLVTTDADCATCHDASAGGTARDAINAPYVAAGEVHNTTAGGNGCAACHNTTTGAKISLAGSADPTTSGTATDYTCIDCHTTGWVTLHSPLSSTTIDHASSLVTNVSPCNNCHNGTAANGLKALTSPFNLTNEVHNAATTNTPGGCLTCHTGNNNGGLISPAPAKGSGLAAGGGTCITCHSTFESAHNHTHTGVTIAASCATATCHDTTGSGGIARAANATPFIGSGEVHETGTCTNCHDATTKLLKIGSNGKGDATVNSGAGGDCIACHINGNAYNNWTDIHTAKAETNHASHVTAAGVCTACHDATGTTDARATSATPFITAGDVHNTTSGGNGCAACHTGANDGGLKTPTNVDQIVSGSCLNCHTNTSTWTTIHSGSDTVDHAAEVANLATCTTSCHTATGNIGAPNIANLVDGTAGNKVHNACADCHNADGSVATVTASGGSGTIDVIAPNGGNCAACHDSWVFDDHGHHTTANNQVIYDSTVDRSQQSDTAANACAECHNDKTGDNTSFNSWDGIRWEHDIWDGTKNATGGCTTCHDYTTNGEKTGDPDTPLDTLVATVIGTDATATCVTCHTKKEHTQATSTHGGHAPNHFGWGGNCSDCHTGADIVKDVHGNNCDLCHTGGVYNADTNGIGPAASTFGIDGDAGLAEGDAGAGNWSSTCITCHPSATYPGAAVHHVSKNNYVANGNCTQCHTDPRTVANNTDLPYATMPIQMSCSRCHVDVTGDTVEIVSITPGVAGSTANGLQTGNVRTALTSHTFTITAGTSYGKIANYGACLYCHGTTGQGAGRATTGPVPFHAQIAYADLGGTIAEGQAQFRIGDVDTGDGGTGDSAFYGHGRGRFNMKHAEFSIKDHYLQGQVAWQSNYGGSTGTWTDINAPEAYAYVAIKSKNADNLTGTYYVPVFDTSFVNNTHCSGTCDTITIDTTKNGTEWNGRVLNIVASSNDNTAQLTVIRGGVATALSCTNGSCTGSLDYSSYPANVRWDASDDDYVWIVSDKGGWAKADPRGTPP